MSTAGSSDADRSVRGRKIPLDESSAVGQAEPRDETLSSVSGQPSSDRDAATPMRWRAWGDLTELFNGALDHEWDTDRDLIDDGCA